MQSLVRVFMLHSEMLLFSADYSFQISSHLCDTVWFQRLAYLSDIFKNINKLNFSF
jgi:hypothetical protein